MIAISASIAAFIVIADREASYEIVGDRFLTAAERRSAPLAIPSTMMKSLISGVVNLFCIDFRTDQVEAWCDERSA
jgi:hypothetical protein